MKDGHSDSLIPQPRNKSAVAHIFDSYWRMFMDMMAFGFYCLKSAHRNIGGFDHKAQYDVCSVARLVSEPFL
jgi:hypothetical protein